MATAGKNADITVANADGSTNKVRLSLWRDAPNRPGGWEEEIISPTPPPQPQGDVNYAAQSPEFGRVLSQNDWHLGFGAARFTDLVNFPKYGYTDGVLAMFDNELVPSYQEYQVDAIVQNGRFETGETTGWTDGSNTSVAVNSDARSGSYSLQITATSAGGTCAQNYIGTDTVLRSREITVVAYAKKVTTSGSGTIKLTVSDGVSTPTDSSTSTSTEWAILKVKKTLSATASAVKFTFTLSADDDVFRIDDVAVILTGGSTFNSRPIEFEGGYYASMGRSVIKWDESNDAWLPVYLDSTYEITAIENYGGNLIVGRGDSTNYLVSGDGATFSNPSTNSGNSRIANKLARVLNARGDWALMKTRANQASLTVDPSDTVNWGAEIQVGDPDRLTTSLISGAGTAYVGREDGLYVYDRRINRFRDIEPDSNFFPSANNFRKAIGRGGAIWASGGQQTFWRISPTGQPPIHDWSELTHIFTASAFKGFGGEVSAIAQDRSNVFIALADNAANTANSFPYTFPFNFSTAGISTTVRLLTIKSQKPEDAADFDRDVIVHTISSFTLSKIDQIGRFDDGTNSSLFALGSFTDTNVDETDEDVPRIFRLKLPRDNENPRRSASIAVRKTGDFYTPWMDFNFPDVEKATSKLTIGSVNFAAGEKYVTVYYKKDDATDDDGSGWTLWGDDGVFDTSPQETKSSVTSTPVTFKRIRFKISFTSDSHSQAPPTVTSIVLNTVWNQTDIRRFKASVRLGDRRTLQLRRVPQTTLKSADISKLTTLRQQPFVQLVTPDGESLNATLKYLDRTISGRVDPLRGTPIDQVRVFDLEFTEVLTS
tara:strand:- start:608 stop:3088 length:2481 start_codon:yes stop_codon:yes gene_type:complete